MTHRAPAHAPTRRSRWLIATTLAVVVSPVVVVLWAALLAAAAPFDTRPDQGSPAMPLVEPADPTPDGGTAFDDGDPGVANLDPALLSALRQAATDASEDGVEIHLTSGWRSAEHQAQLRREAISEYGSEEEAARWVATPETSAHVTGDAVDIGHDDARAWLSAHGAAYGLCQIYANEPWHFELRPDAGHQGCPPMYADPTQDPRMPR